MLHKQPTFVSSRHYVDVAERFMDIGFWNADMTTGEVRGTDGFFRIMGLSNGEAFGLQQWTALLHPEDQEDFRSIYSIIAMGVSVSREVRLVHPQQPARWLRVAVEQSKSTDRVVGLVQDLAGEREARAAIYRERARLNAFIDMTGEIFWSTDLSGVVVDLRGWERITGQSPEQIRNQGWAAAIHPEDRERVLAEWSACFQEDRAFETTYRLRYADGVHRRVLVRGTPVRRESGKAVEWLGVIQEIWRAEAAEARPDDDNSALMPQQLRAARAMLGWSANRLAWEAGVSTATIRRYETTPEHMKEATITAILAALARHGVVMTRSPTTIGLRLSTASPATEASPEQKL